MQGSSSCFVSPCSYTHVSSPRLRPPAHPPSSARVLSTPRRYHGLDGYGTTDAGGDGPARDAYAESLNDDPGDDTCCTVRETVQSLAIHNMRLLLANRTFEAKAGLDGDGWRRGGFDVNAWNVSGTHMRVCGDCSAALTAGWSVRGQWTSACNSGQYCPILLGIGLGWSTHPSLQEHGKKSPRVGCRSPVGGGQFHHRESLQESFENNFEKGLITLFQD